ncbi:MAG: tRNA pseudouridine(38-40) synthase TruA [Deltaproteobacteria bacterium]|jgi:tRNA pseudouridine38-40 synthase|nr:tRNA pseudouridine(38-40) synthase TruA [Deltaproteobacteria bacterium]MBT4526911.1 tRNA pseudouridine(38-40) synthase TruA [Deltaproteobacteria bacterium]
MSFYRNLLAKIEYKGTNYHGWQLQPNAVTIEGTIKKVLAIIFQKPVKIRASSRTDAGVHAKHQLANIYIPAEIKIYQLRNSLNALLPDDIAVVDLVEVADNHRVQNENRGKQYIYRINNSKIPNALNNDFSWWVKSELKLSDMQLAGSDFIGVHNFSAYQGKGCVQKVTEKEIFDLQIESKKSCHQTEIQFTISGSSFLRNMIRIMVGTLVQVGRGRLDIDVVKRTLISGNREEAGITAPPQGLMLNETYLKNDPFIY